MDPFILFCILTPSPAPQIFKTKPAISLGTSPPSHARREGPVVTETTSGFTSPSTSQQSHYQSRAMNPVGEQSIPTYATIPSRGPPHGQLLRGSSSQDHLAIGPPYGPRMAFPTACPVQRVGPPPHYPPHPPPGSNSTHLPTPGTFDPYHMRMQNGTQNRPSRPLAVYQPAWNNSSQSPFVQGLDVISPPSSGSSTDSGTQGAVLRSPSSSPSNATFYGLPNRPIDSRNKTFAPPPPPPPAGNAGSQPPVTGRRVRALYNCIGENSNELSFEPNAIIMNGKFIFISFVWS